MSVLFTFGKEPRSFPSAAGQQPVEIFGAGVFPLQLVIPAVGIAIAGAARSAADAARQGPARGGAEVDAARLMGIDVKRTIALSYRALDRPCRPRRAPDRAAFQRASDMGTLFGIKAFAVAILGGITSASGVMFAGIPLSAWPRPW